MKLRKAIYKILMVLTLSFLMTGMLPAKETQAATDEAKAELRKMIIEMFHTGDTSTRDITNLKLTWPEYNEIFWDVINNECWLEYACCYNAFNQDTTYTENGVKYVSTFYIWNMDSNLPKYTATVRNQLEMLKSQMDSKMTDLDKLVLVHDYIDRINTYDLNAEHGYIHSAVGPLCFGSSVCDGYAKAMNLILKDIGVEAKGVSNANHGWSLVKIDGEYYHVDATWDDTRCYKTGTYKTHYFMMRNDEEYRNDPYSPHTDFKEYDTATQGDITTFSTSTKYTDWYVHSIIGDMYYYDGYWYYVQDGSIVKNKINGTADSYTTVVSGTGLTVVGITDGLLTYKENSEEKTVSLSGNEETPDSGNGNPTGGTTDSENGSTTGENPDNGNGNPTGGTTDNENGSPTGGTTDSGNGSPTGGNPNNGNAENGSIDANSNNENENQAGDEDKESGEAEEGNTQITFKDKKSKAYYKVLTQGKKTGTVVYVKPYSGVKNKVTIPSTVQKNGITYKVTGISANAFKNNSKITQIVIGKNVKTIGQKAFYNCKKLKTITINTTKLTSSSVKKTAFKGINKKVKVKVKKSSYSKYKKLLVSKGLKSKTQIVKK